jgi:transcription initiation factor IIF auxiliary subunit
LILPSRKGHYIVAEYVDKVVNKLHPTYPWHVRTLVFVITSMH